MKYEVVIMPEAQVNISDSVDFIAADSAANSAKWLRGLNKQIYSLEVFPNRCGYARERSVRRIVEASDIQSHRIIFNVDEKSGCVNIVAVRHAKQRAIGEPE